MTRLFLLILAACEQTGGSLPDAGPDAPPPKPAKLAFAMATIAAPDTFVADTFVQTGTILNTGGTASGNVTLTQSGSTEFTDLQSTCTALAPAGTCVFTLTFAPMYPGMHMGFVEAAADPGGVAAVILTGTAKASSLAVAPTSYTFPAQANGTTSAMPLVATVTNQSTVATSPLVVSLAAPFAVSADGCGGRVLAAAATCSVTVDYQPTITAPDGDRAILAITDDPGGIAKVAMVGHSHAPAPFTSPRRRSR